MISSPKPPDPYEQANAQAGANIDSAVANDLLNNRTEITPTGRIDYVDKGTTQYTDSQGNVRDIPIRERVVTLSDGQQDLLDLTESTSKNLLQVADGGGLRSVAAIGRGFMETSDIQYGQENQHVPTKSRLYATNIAPATASSSRISTDATGSA